MAVLKKTLNSTNVGPTAPSNQREAPKLTSSSRRIVAAHAILRTAWDGKDEYDLGSSSSDVWVSGISWSNLISLEAER